MPTGYTADIAKGITFDQYLLGCARAFGALVTMRDSPADAAIPDAFKPSPYNAQQLEKAQSLLAALEVMPTEDAEQAAASAYDEQETRRFVRLGEIKDLRAKYEAMLAAAKAWKPPTPEHQGLADFMQEQINRSIEFDCGTSYHETPTTRLTGEQWLADAKASALRDIEYHTKHHADEVRRCADRTAWVKALRDSLPA
jgi:hypothetical protein